MARRFAEDICEGCAVVLFFATMMIFVSALS